jgi:hydrogenase-4 component B
MTLTLSLVIVAMLLGASPYAIFLAHKNAPDASGRIYTLCAGLCAALLLLALVPKGAEPLQATLPLGLPWIGMHFRVDGLTAFFQAVINLGAVAASVYAIGYGEHEENPGRVLPFYPAFLAGMNLVLMADDAFTFLVAWEFMSLSSWALVVAHHHDEENRRAGFIYLMMASFGTLALLMAFGLLAGSVGGYDFATIRSVAHAPWITGLVLALTLLGAGSKAGLAPLHIWLPLAHPAAPSHVSALMSGVMTKVAVYGFIRVLFDLMGQPAYWWSLAPLTLGATTAVLGILFATIETDLKKLLAYSTIENIGIIFVALGLAIAFKSQGSNLAAGLAFTAALFHVFNHSLFKSLLFFGAGAILTATGEKNIERLGGLIHAMPRTAFLFLGGCVAISALPPLNGFVSEWLLFQAVLLSPSMEPWSLKLLVPAVGVALALTAALCAGCFVRAYGVAFLGRARSAVVGAARETDIWSLRAMSGLLGLCLLAGVVPSFVIDAISPVAKSFAGGVIGSASWLSVAPIAESRSSYNGVVVLFFLLLSAYVTTRAIQRWGSQALRRGPAWDCGFPDPSPVTQYGGSSFAQPVRRVFADTVFVARDHLDMPAPGDTRPARFGVEIHDRVMEGVYDRIAGVVEFCVSILERRTLLTIQGYLTLVFAALVILLLGVAIWR